MKCGRFGIECAEWDGSGGHNVVQKPDAAREEILVPSNEAIGQALSFTIVVVVAVVGVVVVTAVAIAAAAAANAIDEALTERIEIVVLSTGPRLCDENCEGEVAMFLGSVEPPADLGVVGLVVPGSTRDLHLCNMCSFGGIGRPLHHRARGCNAWNNAVHEFQLGDLEMVDWLLPLSDTSAEVKYNLFVVMEEV